MRLQHQWWSVLAAAVLIGLVGVTAVAAGAQFIPIPEALRRRYGFEPNTPVRVIETQSGILLVPLTDAPMSDGLKAELAEWQTLGADALAMFPFEEQE